MIDPKQAALFLDELDAVLASSADPPAAVMRLIANRFRHYQWVGIYWLKDDTLVLGPYVGPPTEHVRIAVGQGVCGTAVAEGKNQIVRDVTTVSNYLACSLDTRSEIVVLIRKEVKILGQIDADSNGIGAFDDTDEALLLEVADRLASWPATHE
ncbi:MAG: GAF domain-containing protein [Planctomycetota bacterium]